MTAAILWYVVVGAAILALMGVYLRERPRVKSRLGGTRSLTSRCESRFTASRDRAT